VQIQNKEHALKMVF